MSRREPEYKTVDGVIYPAVRGEKYPESVARWLAPVFCALVGHMRNRKARWMITGEYPRGGHACVRCEYPMLEWQVGPDGETQIIEDP
jgi:hypothetical protein